VEADRTTRRLNTLQVEAAKVLSVAELQTENFEAEIDTIYPVAAGTTAPLSIQLGAAEAGHIHIKEFSGVDGREIKVYPTNGETIDGENYWVIDNAYRSVHLVGVPGTGWMII
jgi:hypothetical protein